VTVERGFSVGAVRAGVKGFFEARFVGALRRLQDAGVDIARVGEGRPLAVRVPGGVADRPRGKTSLTGSVSPGGRLKTDDREDARVDCLPKTAGGASPGRSPAVDAAPVSPTRPTPAPGIGRMARVGRVLGGGGEVLQARPHQSSTTPLRTGTGAP
jgi:hypothetical protein